MEPANMERIWMWRHEGIVHRGLAGPERCGEHFGFRQAASVSTASTM